MIQNVQYYLHYICSFDRSVYYTLSNALVQNYKKMITKYLKTIRTSDNDLNMRFRYTMQF